MKRILVLSVLAAVLIILTAGCTSAPAVPSSLSPDGTWEYIEADSSSLLECSGLTAVLTVNYPDGAFDMKENGFSDFDGCLKSFVYQLSLTDKGENVYDARVNKINMETYNGDCSINEHADFYFSTITMKDSGTLEMTIQGMAVIFKRI